MRKIRLEASQVGHSLLSYEVIKNYQKGSDECYISVRSRRGDHASLAILGSDLMSASPFILISSY